MKQSNLYISFSLLLRLVLMFNYKQASKSLCNTFKLRQVYPPFTEKNPEMGKEIKLHTPKIISHFLTERIDFY